jgi:tetratricopeptide (TPR) repeat protein
MTPLLDTLGRVAHLAGLVLVPKGFAPEPTNPSAALSIVGGLLVAIPPIVAWIAARRLEALEARVMAALWTACSIALPWLATMRSEEPLLSRYYLGALVLWPALAATTATLAGHYLGTSFRNKRMGAAIATLAVGIFTFRDASTLIASPKDQWRRLLDADPAHEGALRALEPSLDATSDERRQRAEACVAAAPERCLCQLWLAERDATSTATMSHIVDRLPTGRCDDEPALAPRALRLRALGLAIVGPVEQAEAPLQGLVAEHPDDGSLLYALAVVRQRQGRKAEAADLAARAAHAGAGRDASLLELATRIELGELEKAQKSGAELVKKYPDDASIVYDVALVGDRLGRYNEAREGYLKALRLHPGLREARFNLALLTLRQGARDEAAHHARKFVEAWPEDPRGADLALRVSAAH